MNKKTFKLLPIAACILGAALSSSVSATSIDTALYTRADTDTIITDESGEILIKNTSNTGGSTKLEVNDYLTGVLDFTTITPPQESLIQDRELTALFATKVDALTVLGSDSLNTSAGIVNYNVVDYRMTAAGGTFWTTNFSGIDALVNTTFGLGTWDLVKDSAMGFLFDDCRDADPSNADCTDFDRSMGISAGFSSGTDGMLRAIIGLKDSDDYWIARGPDDVSVFALASTGTNLGSFAFGLSFLNESFSVGFADTVNSPTGTNFLGSPYKIPALNTPNTEFYGDGGLFGRGSAAPGVTDPWGVYNKVDVTIHPVPEPSSILLLSIGLLGLGLKTRGRNRI